jgi:hypothetical protein
MKISHLTVAALFLASFLSAHADVLELKNGTILNGTYEGGTAGTLRFQTADGLQVISTAEILALTFTGSPAQAAVAPAPAPVPTPTAAPVVAAQPPAPKAPTPDVMTVPAGTVIMIRTTQVLTSDTAQTGNKFTARLENNLVVDGVVVAPKDTQVYGKVTEAQKAKRLRGQSVLKLTLTELSINGALQPIATGDFAEAGERAGKDVVKGAVAGAAVGALFEGSDGAQDGAAIGAVAGGLRRGESIYIPGGTLLEFEITAPVQMAVAK